MIVPELKHLRGVRSIPRMVKESICCLLLAAFLFLQISCIFKESRTFDEILHLKAGLKFWQENDFTIEPFNPPLVREIISLPLLINKNILNDPFLFWPRMVTVFFAFGLAVIVYLWSGKLSGFFSLLIFMFTPEILAHSHYANTDLIATFFIFLSLFLFSKLFIEKQKVKWPDYLFVAISIGLALAAKTTAIFFVLIPVFSFWLFFLKKEKKQRIGNILIFGIVIFLVIWSTYFFTFEPVLGYRTDPNRQAVNLIKKYPRIAFLLETPVPLGSYLSTIKQNILSNQTNKFPRDTVFGGKYSQGVPGIYIWPLFLIKTPIPLLLLMVFSFLRKNQSKKENFLKLAVILIFLQAVFLGTNLRLRYFLVVYPLLAVSSGNILVSWCFGKKLFVKTMAGGLLLWLMAGTFIVYPHFLTYFNEIVGGRVNGYQYAADSNLDWGQGLPTLQKYLGKRKIIDYQLAYFGNVNPSFYGLNYIRVKDVNFEDIQPLQLIDYQKPLVISASCWYYCGYYKDERLKNQHPKILAGQYLLFGF